MGLFLLTFFLIYGGFHFYFFLKVRAAFAPGAAAQIILVALLILGLMAPIIVRASERYGFETLARLLSWAGYLWMAVLLLFFSASVLFECYRFLAHLAGLALRTDVGAFLPSVRMLFLVPAAAALGIVLYGVFEARCIRSESLVIHSVKIPKEAGRIRIVQISDVHVGVLVRGDYLADILRKVREAAPDLLVSTGDLVDGQGNDLSEAAAQLREIRPRYGKFAVTGNHEFYAGIDEAMKFTANAGFTELRGGVATVAGAIDLVGVDDPGINRLGFQGRPSDREVLSRAGGGRFTILLKHQPLVEENALGAFDLQLSGHTHKGQLFPFSLITRLVFPFHAGNYRLTGGALLHVSRGTGTWGPPVRFLARPEITIIDLMPG
ncbi:MAG: metallophosphoesterase [Deltaproteobacteria bacterium]|nr:metallophosphoesterase [Deltaproteobacteria bacterium]